MDNNIKITIHQYSHVYPYTCKYPCSNATLKIDNHINTIANYHTNDPPICPSMGDSYGSEAGV